MTRPDNDELKRLAEGAITDAIEPIERAIAALKGHIAAVQDAKRRKGTGNSLIDAINGLPEIVRWLREGMFDVEAAFEQYEDRQQSLLSEIEGLKAEREDEDALIEVARILEDHVDYDDEGSENMVGLARRVSALSAAEAIAPYLRTQAPDSWRPDREEVMAIIDANKYEPWTVDRAGQMADAILAVRPQDEAMTAAFVPIDGQCFTSEQDWINRATRVLTGHAQYNNTEHGDASGWRGPHFTALSFDQAGRRVRNGADFKRATVEGTYPVWWIWPDQIVPALRPQTAESGK